MRKVVGYMLTWSTYGTWLRGDRRGYVQNGVRYEGNPGLKNMNRELMRRAPVRLDGFQKKIVRNAILDTAERLGQDALAVAVCSNHVHLVLNDIGIGIGEAARLYKSSGTKAMHHSGHVGNVWAKGYDKRYCFTCDDLARRVGYVLRHGEG